MGRHSFREFVGIKIHSVLDQCKVRDLQIVDSISSDEIWSREFNEKRTKAFSGIFGNLPITYYNLRKISSVGSDDHANILIIPKSF